MIWISTEKISDTKERVVTMDNFPKEGKTEGYYLDSIPEPQVQIGKREVGYYNPKTKEVFYEYIDVPKSQEQILQERIDLMQKAIDNLVLGGVN